MKTVKYEIGIYDINNSSHLNYKERLSIYRKVGFNHIGLYIDNSYMVENENFNDIIQYAKSIGLKILQVHIDYKNSNQITEKENASYYSYLSQCVEVCKKYKISHLVLHASKGDTPPKLSDERLSYFCQFAKSIENVPVCLCFENVRNNFNLAKILSKNLNNVKMCFDIGHSHCYDNEYQLYQKFKSQIVCTHLHNNYGADTHNELSLGNIDLKKFFTINNGIKYLNNCLEIFPPKEEVFDKGKFTLFVEKAFNDYQNSINHNINY